MSKRRIGGEVDAEECGGALDEGLQRERRELRVARQDEVAQLLAAEADARARAEQRIAEEAQRDGAVEQAAADEERRRREEEAKEDARLAAQDEDVRAALELHAFGGPGVVQLALRHRAARAS